MHHSIALPGHRCSAELLLLLLHMTAHLMRISSRVFHCSYCSSSSFSSSVSISPISLGPCTHSKGSGL